MTPKRILDAVLIAVMTALAITIVVAAFALGQKSAQLDCDHWCEMSAMDKTLDEYLDCKSLCHEIEFEHIECVLKGVGG